MTVIAAGSDIEKFIARRIASSGNERANFQSSANELCRIIGVEEPEPAKKEGSSTITSSSAKSSFRTSAPQKAQAGWTSTKRITSLWRQRKAVKRGAQRCQNDGL